MRLTHKYEFKDKRKNREPMLKIRNKLFDLENIEDELGIDLVTYFKIFKNGFVFMIDEDGQIVKAHSPAINDYPQFIYLWIDDVLGGESSRIVATKDYGKKQERGWALTKEELE